MKAVTKIAHLRQKSSLAHHSVRRSFTDVRLNVIVCGVDGKREAPDERRCDQISDEQTGGEQQPDARPPQRVRERGGTAQEPNVGGVCETMEASVRTDTAERVEDRVQ